MSKKKPFEIGYSTSLIHDTKNNTFTEQGIYPLINKLYCYYTDTEIIGFFPMYKDPSLNKEISSTCYFNSFLKEWPSIEKTLKEKGTPFKSETVTFDKGEYITYIKGYYDEHSQKILSIKYSTSKRKANSFGNHTIINNSKDTVNLYKHGSFITGFRTDYIRDTKSIPHLSYIRVYFEKDENIDKYTNISKYNDSYSSTKSICMLFSNFFSFPFQTAYSIYKYISSFLTILLKILILISILLYPFFLYYQTSQNILNGTLKLTQMQNDYSILNNSNIQIHTDGNGITHIKVESTADGYFALGFEHARNRLWAIDIVRRIARGKLSELFGERTKDMDVTMRSFGVNDLARRGAEFIRKNSEYVKEIDAYVKGINYYARRFVLPVEYLISRNTFDEWSVEDSVAIFYFYALILSHDWNMEIWYRKMEESLGKDFAEMVMSYREMGYPFWNETIVNDEELMEMGLHRFRKVGEEEVLRERDLIGKLKKQKEQQHQQEQNESSFHLNSDGASNCWTISGKYTQSGKPLLSNDPHLPNSMPSLFYITKIYFPSTTITGASLPGTPAFATGSNPFISWGVTTENSDNTDICEEIVDNDSFLSNNNSFVPLRTTTETILIKSKEPLFIEIKWTNHGPLISQSIPKELLMLNEAYASHMHISLRNPIYSFNFTNIDFYIKLNHATSQSDFLPYTHMHIAPNYNLHWISRNNDIGWTPIGRIAVKEYYNGFCKGEKVGAAMYIPSKELPVLVNPKKGFIVSANNKFASFNYTYKLHGHHNHVRAYRIREMILSHVNAQHKINVNDTIAMINDVHDSYAEYVLPKLLSIIERNLKQSVNNDVYYQQLKKWDYKFERNSTGATLYAVLEKEIGLNLVLKKLNEHSAKGIINYLHYWNFISGIIDKIYKGHRINMKECVHQSGNTNCEKYLISIYTQLHYHLQKGEYINKDNSIKQWGDILKQYYPHNPFDSIPLLKYAFSRTYSSNGNRNTVKISRGPFNHKEGEFVSTHSANLKFICDMKEPTMPYVSIPGGNGGNALQKYYDVFMDKHERGEMVQIEDVDFGSIGKERLLIIKNDNTHKEM